MEPILLALVSLCVIGHAATVWILLKKQRNDSMDSQALGLEYARIAVAATNEKTPQRMREVAIERFKVIDATADGKRDFTDRQAGVFVDAVLGAGK